MGEGGQTAATAVRGNADLIVRAELEELGSGSLWDAVQRLRGRWLQARRNSSLNEEPAFARVVVDGTLRGELVELTLMNSFDIETLRYLSAPDAAFKYGTGYSGGAIEVSTRGTGALPTGSRTVVGGSLLLRVGSQSQSVAVPVVDVRRVEVRRDRSRSGVGGFIGALLGGGAGAIYLASKYDREHSFHFPQKVYGLTGGVVGALGGLILGASIGSFIKTDVWLEVPQTWVVRYSESGSTTPEGSARATRCPGLDTEAR